MAYIYRYTDLSDNIIKYVGIVYGETRTLKDRLLEHIKDNWYQNREWKIEYITEGIDTEAEARAFETHYINLYETGKYYNTSGVGQGINKYLPNRENDWVEFDHDFLKTIQELLGENQEYKKLRTLESEFNDALRKIKVIKKGIHKNQDKLDSLLHDLLVQEKDIYTHLNDIEKKTKEIKEKHANFYNQNKSYRQRSLEGMAAMPVIDGKRVSLRTGRPTGRPIATPPDNWNDVIAIWKTGEITAVTAMKRLDMKPTTFYKLVKQFNIKKDNKNINQ